MGVTIRVVRGRKVKNPKYTIRRTVKIHTYNNDGRFGVRVSDTYYKGKTENDPARTSTFATVNVPTNNGTRRSYVPISKAN